MLHMTIVIDFIVRYTYFILYAIINGNHTAWVKVNHMPKLIDKLVLLSLCILMVFFLQMNMVTTVVSLLTSVILTSVSSYFENKISIWMNFIYILLCLWNKNFIIFLPLISYDCFGNVKWYVKSAWGIPILFHFLSSSPLFMASSILLCLLSLLLQQRTNTYQTILQHYHQLQDDTKERALHLEHKNNELMEKQDYEIQVATLTERNRIAREIHDNVGHLLTRSILQVGALQIVHAKDDTLSKELLSMKDTLSDAMDNIRNSVHDLHNESIDLKVQLSALLEEFNFCPVKLIYESGEIPVKLKYCMIAIVKEALSNIAKHSNATEAFVMVLEHPALYQLVIKDNGTLQKQSDGNGIGLQNMKDRIEGFHGILRTEQNHGFKIFISIPKERQQR